MPEGGSPCVPVVRERQEGVKADEDDEDMADDDADDEATDDEPSRDDEA